MDEQDVEVVQDNVDTAQSDVPVEEFTLDDKSVKAIAEEVRSGETTQIVSVDETQYNQYLQCQASINICLMVLIALAVVIAGELFASILTRLWKVR